MLQIKAILKDRIQDIKYYQKIQELLSQLNPQSDVKTQFIDTNKINQTKKVERHRCQKQANLLMSLNLVMLSNSKQIQEFYYHSVEIFSFFDGFFQKFKNKFQLFSISMQENLRKIYTLFFNKYAPEQFELSESLISDISSLSPSFFFGLIRKWSRNLLNSKIKFLLNIQKAEKQDFIKNLSLKEKQIKFNSHQSVIQKDEEISMKIESESIKRQIVTAIQIKNKIQRSTIGYNKQNIYSYCLQEMREYYKSIPILDLDHHYLKSFKKIGKKQDLFNKINQKQIVAILAHRQNKFIMDKRQEFSQEFQRYIKRKYPPQKNIIENNSQIILNQNKKQTSLRDIFLNKSYQHKVSQSHLLSQKKSIDFIISSLAESKSKEIQNKMGKLQKISIKNQKFNIQFPPIKNAQKYQQKEFQRRKFSFLQNQNFQLQNIIKGSKRLLKQDRKPPKSSFQLSKKQQSSAFGLVCSGINNQVHQKKEMFKIDRGLFYKQQTTRVTQQNQKKTQQKQVQDNKQSDKKNNFNKKDYLRQMIQIQKQKQFQTEKQIMALIQKQKINKLQPLKRQYKNNSKQSIKNEMLASDKSELNQENLHLKLTKNKNVNYIEEYRNQKKLLKLLVFQQNDHQF